MRDRLRFYTDVYQTISKGTSMCYQRSIKTLLLFIAMTAGVAQIVSAQTPEARLNGEYIVSVYEQEVQEGNPDFVRVGTQEVLLVFDVSRGGTFTVLASSNPAEVGETGPFTYFASRDGNFVMVFPDPEHEGEVDRLLGVVSADGQMFSGVDTDSDAPTIFVGIKKSSGRTDADLSGTFILNLYEGNEAQAPEIPTIAHAVEVRASRIAVTLNGNGTGSFQELASSGGDSLESGPLTYAVSDSGTFTVAPAGEGPIRGIVSADGSTFTLIGTEPDDRTIGVGIKKSSGNTNASLTGAYIFNFFEQSPDEGSPQTIQNETSTQDHGDRPQGVTNKLALIFNGNGSGAFQFLASSSGEFESGLFTYSVSDSGTFTLIPQDDEDPTTLHGILNPDGRSFAIIATDSTDDLLFGSGIKTTREINIRMRVSGKVGVLPFDVIVSEGTIELDRVHRLGDVDLPEELPQRDAIQALVDQLADLRLFIPSTGIDDDDVTLIFNLRNLNINPLDFTDITIDPVTVGGQEVPIFFFLRMQIEKDGVVRSRFDFNPGNPMTLWAPLGAMQSLIADAGFGEVSLDSLTLAFLTDRGLTQQGIFTAFNPATQELVARVRHLSDLVGVRRADLSPPPPAAIVRGPDVVPDTTFARVLWQTSQPTNSVVEFSTDSSAVAAGNGTVAQTPADSLGVTDHQVLITGLTKLTRYFYRIVGTDVFDQTFVSPIFSFRTRGVADLAAPIITLGPFTPVVLPDQAVVRWGTDRLSNSVVRFDSTADIANPTTVSDPALVLDHRVTLTGLAANKTYYYIVSSTGGGTARSDTARFTTPSVIDPLPPVIIRQPRVDDFAVTDTTALITARTRPATIIEVFYWVDGTTDTLIAFNTQPTTDHQIVLTRLPASTRHNYFARFTRVENNTFTDSRERHFRTRRPDVREPLRFTRFPAVLYKTDRRVVMGWETNLNSNTTIYYQPDPAGTGIIDFDQAFVRSDPRFEREHRIAAGGLEPNTPYLLAVASRAPNGEILVWPPGLEGQLTKPITIGPNGEVIITGRAQVPGSGGRFTTNSGPDTQSPVILAGPTIVAQNNNQLVVQWETDELSTSTVDFGTGGSLDQTVFVPDQVTLHQVTLTNLSPSTSYTYAVSSTDPSNNGPTTSAQATAVTTTTADTAPPQIDAGSITAAPSDDRAVILWTTNEGATSEISYGTSADSLSLTLIDATIVTDHSVTLTGLSPSTAYFYRVKSTDAAGNGPVQSATQTFTTTATPDDAAPVISNVNVSSVAKADGTVNLTFTWNTDKFSTSFVDYDTLADLSTQQTVGDNTARTSHSVTVTGLSLNTTYHYRVGSANVHDTAVPPTNTLSPASGADSLTTPDTADINAPNPPSTVTAIPGDGAVLLRWSPSTDAESGIGGYNINRGGTALVSNVTDTAFVDNTAANGTAVTYTIVAVDKAGNAGTASAPTSSVTPGTDKIAGAPSASALPDTVSLKPILVIGNATPVAGDATRATLTYAFQVATDSSFTDIVASVTGIAEGTSSNPTHWQVEDPLRTGGITLDDGVKYYWRARANDGAFDGQWSPTQSFVASASEPTGVEEDEAAAVPRTFALHPNYPNPFNPVTTIRFDLPKPAVVKLVVYNILGQEVIRLIDNEAMAAGFHQVTWNGRNAAGHGAATGVYFYRIQAGEFTQARKMLLVK